MFKFGKRLILLAVFILLVGCTEVDDECAEYMMFVSEGNELDEQIDKNCKQ